MKMTEKKKLEIGKRYNSVVVTRWVSTRKVSYVCDCGNEKECEIYDLRRETVRSCGCYKQTDEYKSKHKARCNKHLNVGGDFHTDELTPFRYLHKSIRRSVKKCARKNSDDLITLEDLSDIWDLQDGKCIYSGVDLLCPTHSETYTDPNIYPQWTIASIDRIDSNQPYVKDNIQFISRTLNYAKNSMTHDMFTDFMQFMRLV
jgi:hypothetical protein